MHNRAPHRHVCLVGYRGPDTGQWGRVARNAQSSLLLRLLPDQARLNIFRLYARSFLIFKWHCIVEFCITGRDSHEDSFSSRLRGAYFIFRAREVSSIFVATIIAKMPKNCPCPLWNASDSPHRVCTGHQAALRAECGALIVGCWLPQTAEASEADAQVFVGCPLQG